MNIIPISSVPIVQASSVPGGNNPAQENTSIPFRNIFESALKNVEETQAQVQQDNYNLAIGDVDNIAEITMNADKAEMAFQLFVQFRNQALEAYNEIMRLNI